MILKQSTLNLFFPQWQGAGNISLHEGACQLRDAPSPRRTFTSVPVSQTYSLSTQQNILGYSQIVEQLWHACRILSRKQPCKIFTLGGDCGVELAPISYLNAQYDSSIAIIWLDAHGDLNTPKTSPSGHFHGMPLRSLLGEGQLSIQARLFSTLRAEQIFLVGTRELDLSESKFIQRCDLSVTSVRTINQNKFDNLVSQIKRAGFKRLYLHVDLDVLDSQVFSAVACPTPKGIELSSLMHLMNVLTANFEVVGSSLLEALPTQPKEKDIALCILNSLTLENASSS